MEPIHTHAPTNIPEGPLLPPETSDSRPAVGSRPSRSRRKLGWAATGGLLVTAVCVGCGLVNRDKIGQALFPQSNAPTEDVLGTLMPIVNGAIQQVQTEFVGTVRAAEKTPTPPATATPTATASKTAESTRKATRTAAVPPSATATRELLGGIPDCYPLKSDEVFSSASANQPNEMRDAANTLPENVVLSNSQSVEDVRCWILQMKQGYKDGTLKEGDITTFEKIRELLGNPDEVKMDVFGLEDVRAGKESQIGAVGIVTSADNLSETIVRLSEQLAAGARAIQGPDANVQSAASIASQMAQHYALEGMWYPGIDPRRADEIFKMCLTVRSPLAQGTRQDQPESAVFAEWRANTKLGEERLTGNIYQLSNQDGMMFMVSLVDEDGLKKMQEEKDPNHQIGVARVSDGTYALFRTFDVRNLIPNTDPVLNAADAAKKGSGGELIECGPGEVAPTAAARPTLTFNPATGTFTMIPPSERPLPTRTPGPNPSDTPGPGDTPRPTDVPQPSSTNTPRPADTPRPTDTPVPTVTDAPTQPIQPSATVGATETGLVSTPTITPEPHNTPETPVATPTPLPTSVPSNTPVFFP